MRRYSNRLLKRGCSARAKGVKTPGRNLRKITDRIVFESLERRQLLAITTTYDFVFDQNPDLTFTESQAEVTSLSNNGFAVTGTHSGNHTDLDVFTANLTGTLGAKSLTGTNSAMDQLTNDNLVIVSQDTDSILYSIRSSTGAEIVQTVDLGVIDSTDPDVAALTGGRFVIVSTNEFGSVGGNSGIDVNIRDSFGNFVKKFTVDLTRARDLKPAIAALDDGSFAVAWHRLIGVKTEVWFAVYDANGTVVKAPTRADADGTVNKNVDVAPKVSGFAIVYEDNGWNTGNNDITMAEFSSRGDFETFSNISNPSLINDGSDDANPRVTRFVNESFVVAWENNEFADTDTKIGLFNHVTNTVLMTKKITGGEINSDDVGDISISGSLNARVNVFHTNFTDADVDGESVFGQRTSVSNGEGDVIAGDDLVDFITGAGGNDTLFGRKSDDTLNGGTGDDVLNGEQGNDILIGMAGADQIDGGPGNDAAFYTNSPEAVFIDLLLVGTASGGHAEGDVLSNIERLSGSAFGDILYGGNANNILIGNGGADFLGGDPGQDTLSGGDGDDVLWGGAGADTLRGGLGADIFDYDLVSESGVNALRDRIVDFSKAQGDLIDISDIDGTKNNNATFSFTFIGSEAFTEEGQIRAFQVGSTTVVEFNTDDLMNGAEMQIALRNFTALTLDINDFILAPFFMQWYPDGSSGGPGFSSISSSPDADSNDGSSDVAATPRVQSLSNQAGAYSIEKQWSSRNGFDRSSSNMDENDSVTNRDLDILDSVFSVLGR